jgi:long-subunit acyl-CoA synthetase (AMP-forming)
MCTEENMVVAVAAFGNMHLRLKQINTTEDDYYLSALPLLYSLCLYDIKI